MITFNKNTLRDQIRACWIGKNIGGTMGGPYECKQEMNDIAGFITDEGVILPNDDLDLQLIWLRAMEEQGPKNVDEQVLGEYWLTYIMPHWKEYGVGKSNLREGFSAPISGQLNNRQWRNSNGAWIRTEIWACLFPGMPEKALEYAYYDACVDHGHGEGTVAAMFVAAMESAAFVMTDLEALIALGLSQIPAESRVARSVRLVLDHYHAGTPWKETRAHLVADSADLGWFQAPANIGFAVLGLLYGEGDFKKSMILAIDCGDDTDCTAATVGSLLGILHGTAGIPADWARHVGDKIVQMCLLPGHGDYPASCTELTDSILNLQKQTLYQPFYHSEQEVLPSVQVSDAPADFSAWDAKSHYGCSFAAAMLARTPYAYRAHCAFFEVIVTLEGEPQIAPLGTIKGQILIENRDMPEQKHYHLRWLLPDGWHAEGQINLHAHYPGEEPKETATAPFTLTAGETTEPLCRPVLEVTCPGRTMAVYVSMPLMG